MTKMYTKRLLIFLGIISMTILSMAQAPRNYLSGSLTPEQLKSLLIPWQSWHPYPTIFDQEEWNIMPSLKDVYIKDAQQYLGKSWEILPATWFLDFARNGNRSRYEAILFGRRQRLASMVMAEVFENKGKYLDDISNGIWAICEETFWGVPAHLGAQKRSIGLPDVTEPTIDLFAAETGALLAWTSYLLGERLNDISPLILERIYLEEDRRIIKPFLDRNDFWWMGFDRSQGINNWNPWINSNILNIVLLLEKDNVRRNQAVYKAMQSIDVFINSYPDDGGCDEGPGYWGRAGASLFDCLELLYLASDGKINIYNQPLVQKIGQFIYKAWIYEDYYINFADASAINHPEAGLIYRFGKRINDPVMVGFGAFLAQRENLGNTSIIPSFGSFVRFIPDLFVTKDLLAEKSVEPYISDFWLPGLQVMAARSYADSEKGLYFAAKGGHNAESHNHNDVGNFIVYVDGKPLFVDIGVETYTAKTFSSNRYDIWTMQSQYHNLPTINGIQQKEGPEYKARNLYFSSNARQVKFSMDIAGAYPSEASVNYWNRELKLDRGKRLVLSEKYQLKEWKEPVRLNIMTAFYVDVSIPGRIILTDSKDPSRIFTLIYDPAKFTAAAEEKQIIDGRLKAVWGNRLARIVFTAKDKSLQDGYQIILKKQ
jgi:hypothetical protein